MPDFAGELQRLLGRKDVRSADRAYMQTMLKKLRGGDALSYQEQQNLWAYLVRYEGTGAKPGAR